jgi:hypothetical protein
LFYVFLFSFLGLDSTIFFLDRAEESETAEEDKSNDKGKSTELFNFIVDKDNNNNNEIYSAKINKNALDNTIDKIGDILCF